VEFLCFFYGITFPYPLQYTQIYNVDPIVTLHVVVSPEHNQEREITYLFLDTCMLNVKKKNCK